MSKFASGGDSKKHKKQNYDEDDVYRGPSSKKHEKQNYDEDDVYRGPSSNGVTMTDAPDDDWGKRTSAFASRKPGRRSSAGPTFGRKRTGGSFLEGDIEV